MRKHIHDTIINEFSKNRIYESIDVNFVKHTLAFIFENPFTILSQL